MGRAETTSEPQTTSSFANRQPYHASPTLNPNPPCEPDTRPRRSRPGSGSAVVRTTSFPSCASSYKLDCFCEANKSEIQLAPEVEELCEENGVPKEEISKYLCDDTAVPASPRRGSAPMIRTEEQPQGEPESEYTTEEDGECDEEASASASTDTETPVSASKRAITPNSTRLLIPENDTLEREVAVDGSDDDNKTETEDGMANTNAIYQVITVTETRTECSCEQTATPVDGSAAVSEPLPAPTSVDSDDNHDAENNTDINMSSAMHGTQIAVAILPTPSQMSIAHAAETDDVSASSVRVASSDVPVPTGLDAEQKHGAKQDDGADIDAEMFRGNAGVIGVSKEVVLGLIGVAAGVVLL
ncbi:extracellular serine rich protein [Aspergillus mulundensis]|uniref:Uncharacterized protein n=1 Tax=Aspergillus mulundensis TaxID=1810919 RepID=A0A3D8SKS2_9EURO|nr:Uncharacterized protein DSM5745_03494 [Aspergillus mulundensis]RDW86852.1 Uncharacterized protein DSM5745_03494 [Aspergillus mulundensis]